MTRGEIPVYASSMMGKARAQSHQNESHVGHHQAREFKGKHYNTISRRV